MNLPQHVKTTIGVVENAWVIGVVSGMMDKVRLTASQICGFKDYAYGMYKKEYWKIAFYH